MDKAKGYVKVIHSISRVLDWIARGVLVLLALSVLIDIISRNIGRPIAGNVEIGEMLLVAIAYLGLAFAHMQRGHVRVEIVYQRYSTYTRRIVDLLTDILATVVFTVMVWALASKVISIVYSPGSGPLSPGTLALPLSPMYIMVAIAVFVLCLELITDIISTVSQLTGKKLSDS